MIHQPCRCVGGSEATIHLACRFLEASQQLPGSHSRYPRSRCIGPVGVSEAPKPRSPMHVGVWRLPASFKEAIRSLPNHDPLALSVFGRLTDHDPSCLSVFGSLPRCSEVTIYRACKRLEATLGATRLFGPGVGLPRPFPGPSLPSPGLPDSPDPSRSGARPKAFLET